MRQIIQIAVTLIETALHGAEALAGRIQDPAVKAEAKHALATIHTAADHAFCNLRANCPEALDGVTLRSGGTGKNEPPPPPPGG
jgi:hypothetical protein